MTRAILLIPAMWPAVGAGPSLVTRVARRCPTARGRTALGPLLGLGRLLGLGGLLSLGGVAVPTGRAGPGIRGAVGLTAMSRLTDQRAWSQMSPGAVMVATGRAGLGSSSVGDPRLTGGRTAKGRMGGRTVRGRMGGDRPGPGGVLAPVRRARPGSSSAVGLTPTSWPTAQPTPGQMDPGAVVVPVSRAGLGSSSVVGPR